MPAMEPPSPNAGFFNDLTRQPSYRSNRSDSPPDQTGLPCDEADGGIPRPKRIACIICRKRKLKCDGAKPSCGKCSRLGHKCAYDEARRKSGPKRGYVKELEARLAQVETQLKFKDGAPRPGAPIRSISQPDSTRTPMPPPGFQLNDLDMGLGMGDHDMMSGYVETGSDRSNISASRMMPNALAPSDMSLGTNDNFSWEMIGLGLEEPLPPQDMIDDMHRIYFDKIHLCIPMIHKYRYLAAMNLAPHMRPPVCLRYIMWALACSVAEKYFHYQEVFYLRARKYIESDEMKGHGECFITVGHSQCWTLIATYEFKMMYFPRAWMSSGRATRLAQMMGLHRLDGVALEVKQTLPPPRDWTDREERRRTFWLAYCGDRYASIGTGWPLVIEEKDIMTNLPSTEQAFEQSKSQTTLSLPEAMTAEGASSLSPLAGVVLMACLFGRNLTHLHRPDPNDHPEDPSNGEFWKRHRALDNILLNTSMFLPEHLRLPTGIKDANIVYLNMNIHASTICLHQAAILKAEKHSLGPDLIRQSTDRCFLAANEIVNIMQLITNIDVGSMNPFTSFCLYVAARIFLHAYKKRPQEQQIRDKLNFLMTAMQALQKKNPLAESFLAQLTVDIDGSGLENPCNTRKYRFPGRKVLYETHGLERSCAPRLYNTRPDASAGYQEPHSNPNLPAPGILPSSDNSFDVPLTRYTMSDFSIPTREHRSPQQGSQHSNAAAVPSPGVMPYQIWNSKYGSGTDAPPLHKSTFDTEMISEPISSERHGSLSTSSHPTPTTSHHGSSNTSYSPPSLDVPDVTDVPHQPQQQQQQHMPETTGPPPNPFSFQPTAPFAGFTPPPSDHFPSAPRGLGESDQFTLPLNWDMGSAGPAGQGTGMSPLGETGWSQMLEMGWEGPIEANGEWRPGMSERR